MKRLKQLQPLSREHHLGLVLSRHAKECTDDVELISEHWGKLTNYIDDNMQNHFKVEDDLILAKLASYESKNSKVTDVINKLAQQHQQLYQLTTLPSLTAQQVRELGEALYEHIRFEERELFPLVQEVLSEQELNAIYAASSANVKREEEGR